MQLRASESTSNFARLPLSFELSSTTSELKSEPNPPLALNPNGKYLIGLISFETFNSIPNITEGVNNQFKFEHGLLELPTGTYEIDAIAKVIQEGLEQTKRKDLFISISPNRNTLKTVIKANFDIDFSIDNSIGPLLGFTKRSILPKDISHTSDSQVNILNINTIAIECNLVSGSYKNSEPSHILYSFFPQVEAGYKISLSPTPVKYLPLNTNYIDHLLLRIVDQDGQLVSFRGETINATVQVIPDNGY